MHCIPQGRLSHSDTKFTARGITAELARLQGVYHDRLLRHPPVETKVNPIRKSGPLTRYENARLRYHPHSNLVIADSIMPSIVRSFWIKLRQGYLFHENRKYQAKLLPSPHCQVCHDFDGRVVIGNYQHIWYGECVLAQHIRTWLRLDDHHLSTIPAPSLWLLYLETAQVYDLPLVRPDIPWEMWCRFIGILNYVYWEKRSLSASTSPTDLADDIVRTSLLYLDCLRHLDQRRKVSAKAIQRSVSKWRWVQVAVRRLR